MMYTVISTSPGNKCLLLQTRCTVSCDSAPRPGLFIRKNNSQFSFQMSGGDEPKQVFTRCLGNVVENIDAIAFSDWSTVYPAAVCPGGFISIRQRCRPRGIKCQHESGRLIVISEQRISQAVSI